MGTTKKTYKTPAKGPQARGTKIRSELNDPLNLDPAVAMVQSIGMVLDYRTNRY